MLHQLALPAVRRTALAILLLTVSLSQSASGEQAASRLTANNLLLIVNKNEPAGLRLAEFYAQQRQVPAGRILTLDLPRGDELSAQQFSTSAVSVVRAFLKDKQLEEQVTCLVTFYGVPLRVGQRVNSPEASAEYVTIDQSLKTTVASALQALATVEEVASEARAGFKPPGTGQELPAIAARADAAIRTAIEALPTDTDADRRVQRFSRLMAAIEVLYGPLEAQERLSTPAYQTLATRPVSEQDQAARRQATQKLIAEIQQLNPQAVQSPAARARMRDLFLANLGLIRSMQVILDHKFRLETQETQAAFDSELACLWWPDTMLRFRWHENPLHYRIRYQPAGATPTAAARPAKTLMVCRLDAPTEKLVQDMIATSIRVEADGLKGGVAIDARGKAPSDAYGKFDEKLREVASDLKTKSRAEVVLDDAEPVFAPRSQGNIALYCGWYSLRNYVPGMTFVPGAVGYHVASGEMISLHHPAEKGWCANLLKDGVVATLGPVAEPYLHAFPLPTEFFPLLMTGKLKLAEVYWLTNPLVSWMNVLIGDPLYCPYAKSPPMKDVDVSHQLRVIFAATPATQPAR